MHSAQFNSPQQLAAALVASCNHSERRPTTKPEQHQRKVERREFREEISACLYGQPRPGVSL